MHKTALRQVSRALSGWQKFIVTKQKTAEKEIPHPAAAPISTDQEAGGASTTPDGRRLYENKPESNKPQTKDR